MQQAVPDQPATDTSPDLFPEVIDSTMRAAFVACEKKFHYGHVMHLAPARPSIHLHAGAVFAKGLETVRLAFYRDGASLEEALDTAFTAMILEWGSEFEPTWSWDDPDEVKTLDNLMNALVYYFEIWPPADDLLKPYMRQTEAGPIPSVEFTFAIPIPDTQHPQTGNPVLYGGRFDMLAVREGVLYVEDDKTTKALGKSWNDQWKMRSQFTGYCWAAREYGYPVAGAVVRGISLLKRGFGNAECVVQRSDWFVDRWLAQLQRDIQRMTIAFAAGDFQYNLDDACNAYGGCPFRDLCLSPHPERWMGDFAVREWNPMVKES